MVRSFTDMGLSEYETAMSEGESAGPSLGPRRANAPPPPPLRRGGQGAGRGRGAESLSRGGSLPSRGIGVYGNGGGGAEPTANGEGEPNLVEILLTFSESQKNMMALQRDSLVDLQEARRSQGDRVDTTSHMRAADTFGAGRSSGSGGADVKEHLSRATAAKPPAAARIKEGGGSSGHQQYAARS